MARIARCEVFCPTQTNCILTVCTAVSGRQLADKDSSESGKGDQRRALIEDQIALFSQYFAIDLIAFSLDSSCLRQILLSNPQLAQQLSPQEVARRWLIICPSLRKHAAPLHQPSEKDISQLCEDPGRIERIRRRLSDVTWWNRLLCQRIAQAFNKLDNLKGHFWADRFRSTLLLDPLSWLLCLMFIDIINRMSGKASASADGRQAPASLQPGNQSRQTLTQMHPTAYQNLLDWTHQKLSAGPANTPQDAAVISILSQRQITMGMWFPLILNFTDYFTQIAGRLESMDRHVSRIRHRRFYVRPQTRRLLHQQSLS
jgi:hypothetical protein